MQMNREDWLTQSAELILAELISPHTGDEPMPAVSISVGYGKGRKDNPVTAYKQGDTWHVFVSPELGSSSSMEILDHLTDTLVKMYHPSVTLRLVKNITSQEAVKYLQSVIDLLGEIPQGALVFKQQAKQSTRMLKLECNYCGAVWRMSRKWADKTKYCPCCGIAHEPVIN